MIRFGRRSGALLLGIATGGMLVGGAAVAAPATAVPQSWQTVLGAGEPARLLPSSPAESRPEWRTATAVAAALPVVTAKTAGPGALPAVPVNAILADDLGSDGSLDETVEETRAGYVAEVIELTNLERRAAGCGDLAPDSRLRQAAQDHASDMAENDYFSHSSEDGTRFDTRIRAEGYARPGGENIGMGQTSAAQVVREWMASPPHRRMIETCALTTIGVGWDDNYWVQDFGR